MIIANKIKLDDSKSWYPKGRNVLRLIWEIGCLQSIFYLADILAENKYSNELLPSVISSQIVKNLKILRKQLKYSQKNLP